MSYINPDDDGNNYYDPHNISLYIKFDGQWAIHDANVVSRQQSKDHYGSLPVDDDEFDNHWEDYNMPEFIQSLQEACHIAFLHFGTDNQLGWGI